MRTRPDKCANCNERLGNCDGVSGLYNPGPNSFILCEDCWLCEEDAVDEKGTNVMPETIAHYTRNQPEGAN